MTDQVTVGSCMTEALRPFLREKEKVLLCFASYADCALEKRAADAVAQLGGEVVSWAHDRRWYGLLRQIFSQRTTALVGTPKLILGLAKIAKATGTPLPVRHVVLVGDVQAPWLLKGIRDSLDAQIHICNSKNDVPCLNQEQDPLQQQLEEMLLSWSSILDFRASRTEVGLSLEILTFPGRQLPRLPSGASVTVRPWKPKTDIPFCLCEG